VIAGGWPKMSNEPLAREREPIDRVRARLEALARANAAPRCGARVHVEGDGTDSLPVMTVTVPSRGLIAQPATSAPARFIWRITLATVGLLLRRTGKRRAARTNAEDLAGHRRHVVIASP
jgi:hypothetical protein